MLQTFWMTVFFLASPVISLFAAQSNNTETLTISTYYPSPYGVYRNLRLYPSNEPTNGVDRGVLYFNNTTEQVYYYKNTTTKWVVLSGSSGEALVNAAHTQSDCTTAGGTVVDTDTSLKQCHFSQSSCPSGWVLYKSFTATKATSYTGSNTYSSRPCPGLGCPDNPCYPSTCTTTYHSWNNLPVEACTITTDWTAGGSVKYGTAYRCTNEHATKSAVITEIGCY
jgi:hypothetical protein